jgi:hypothetical protein
MTRAHARKLANPTVTLFNRTPLGRPTVTTYIVYTAIIVVLTVLRAASAQADETGAYVEQNWKIFHRLFDGHNLRPGWLCQDKTKDCERLLAALQRGNFKFVVPVGYGDRPDSPIRKTVTDRCPGLDTAMSDQFPEPLHPTTGFALFELPEQSARQSFDHLYLWRSESYSIKGRLVADGLMTVFTFSNCKILRRHPVVKSHRSSNVSDTAYQETASLAEPIVIDGKVLLLNFNAYNDEKTPSRQPLYRLSLTDVLGDARSGAKAYSFSGKGD